MIDVVLSGSANIPHVVAKYNNAPQNIERALAIKTYYDSMFGVIRAKQTHRHIQLRYLAGPMGE